MLELVVKRTKSDSSEETTHLRHDLYVNIRELAKYILEDGRKIDFLEKCGVTVPETQQVAQINFYNSEHALISSGCDTQNVLQYSVEGELLYTHYSQVIAAFGKVMSSVKDIEKQEIDIKKVCPEAKTARKGQVIVSVADLGKYFNGFRHDSETGLHNNYISVRREGSRLEDITFLPGNGTLTQTEGERVIC